MYIPLTASVYLYGALVLPGAVALVRMLATSGGVWSRVSGKRSPMQFSNDNVHYIMIVAYHVQYEITMVTSLSL